MDGRATAMADDRTGRVDDDAVGLLRRARSSAAAPLRGPRSRRRTT
jgi:hypothetical protein